MRRAWVSGGREGGRREVVGLGAPPTRNGPLGQTTFHVKHGHSETRELDCAVIPFLASAHLLGAKRPPDSDPIGLHPFGVERFT